ncbi:alpha/beta hydrolase [Candidatus Dojkabacteria bacterium]|uniref:Alpha/beta hydrolase n=1 Tax=Candidatus Dojkabacteria bacterium TaxID=2099670 RepID=A0A955L444_9BACT|nr:alpha/beta hydrolase [Candidatus Dojkabacteria bacterium]
MINKKTILIHGYAGRDLSFWLQWIEEELKKEKVTTYFPAYEDSKQPKMDQWVNLFKEELSDPDCEYSFVAHSMGCLVTLKLIEQLDLKLNNVVLVACPKNMVLDKVSGSLSTKVIGEERRILNEFFEQQYDWDLINSKISNLHFFFSDDDFAVPIDAYDYYKEIFPEAEFKIFNNYGHFNRKNDIYTLPEALELIK